jgi:hypothetical protein
VVVAAATAVVAVAATSPAVITAASAEARQSSFLKARSHQPQLDRASFFTKPYFHDFDPSV